MTLTQVGERFSISATRVPDMLDAAMARAWALARAV
jgi:DNA-directed RNA polymerase sigma subunit (sigma70/sigma32)